MDYEWILVYSKIYIKANNDIFDEAVYILPIISNLISYENFEQQCILKEIFSTPKQN